MRILKILGVTILLISTSFTTDLTKKNRFPYQKAGLSQTQAAAHLLERFSFGAKPNEIELIVKMGHEKWFQKQLNGEFDDSELHQILEKKPLIKLTYQEISQQIPLNAQLRNRIVKEGLLSEADFDEKDRRKIRPIIFKYLKDNNLYDVRQFSEQTISQKIFRAAISKNQLHEVMTDFWFNHFNVSMSKNVAMRYVLPYERDVIRPNVTGKFKDLLLGTAKSPAMLFYLDNYLSTKPQEENKEGKMGKKRSNGLNENYAREVMELHTLGVDGGYNQSDVTEAAKIFTGWTIRPMGFANYGNESMINDKNRAFFEDRGGILEESFMFTPNRHQPGPKTVLGKIYDKGGYQDGEQFLNDLAKNKATANHICKKIATRFVSDAPSAELIEKMAKVFLKSDGDIKKVLWTMVNEDEFWSKKSLRQKTKSPFELAISAIRCTNTEIVNTEGINTWITKMGQKIYHYQAPTGYPDQAKHWVNSASLLNRMNFGLALANSKIRGLKTNPEDMLMGREPESVSDAIATFGKMILPERAHFLKLDQLEKLVQEPNIEEKIANKIKDKATDMNPQNDEMDDLEENKPDPKNIKTEANSIKQIVGVLIGSPEFQRR